MFLCVAMVFTSCDMFKQDKPVGETPTVVVDSPEVAADKAAIVKALTGAKLGDIFAEIEEVTLPELDEVETIYNDAITSVKKIEAEANVSVSGGPSFNGVIVDGGAYLYGDPQGVHELGAAIVMAGEKLYVISNNNLGFSIDSENIALPDVSDEEFNAEMEQYLAQVEQYMAQIEYYVDLIDGITVPTLTSSLITKNGDWYMLNRDFTRSMIKSYIVGISTEQGETLDAEALASLDKELAKIDPDLGFAVSGEKIRGVKLDATIHGETTTYPNGYEQAPVMVPFVTKLSAEALLTADLKSIDRVAMGVSQDNVTMAVAMDVEATSVKLDVEYGVDTNSIKASATVNFDAEAAVVNSLAVAAEVAGSADQSVKAALTVNFDNFTKANADVIVFDLDYIEADTLGTIDASLKNDADGNGVVNFKVATNGVSQTEVTGTIDYDKATNVPAEDEFVFTMIENYAAYEAKAQELLEAYFAGDVDSGYPVVVYYDAELDATIAVRFCIDGSWSYEYDEFGCVVNSSFTPALELSRVENIYVSEGNVALDGYYAFDVTFVDGEYVFTAHINENDGTNGPIPGVDENMPEGEE